MRICLAITFSSVALAAGNSAAGNWKLSTEQTVVKGCPVSTPPAQTLTIPSGIYTGSTTPAPARTPKSAAPQPGVALFQVSPDGNTLTVSPASSSDCRMVYKRQ